MNVIQSNPQDKYVPWLICMDSSKDNLNSCDSQVGISKPASSASKATIEEYLKVDEPIQATPTVQVNGKNVKTSYSAIRSAICEADPSLSGCTSPVPTDADTEIQQFCEKPSRVVV